MVFTTGQALGCSKHLDVNVELGDRYKELVITLKLVGDSDLLRSATLC